MVAQGTIVEAARSLYAHHGVGAIKAFDAGKKNLGETSRRIEELIDEARTKGRKIICFLTGVPGAGKTLVGLNVATQHARTESPTHAVLPEQVITASMLFDVTPDGSIRLPRTLDRDLAALKGGSPAQVEEALYRLGLYLGLTSSRPDHEHGTGPDVLWIESGKSGLCIDAKTDKETDSVYRKEDVGQLSDHVQWVLQNSDCTDIVPVFVGPEVPCSDKANPGEEVRVADLKHFAAVADQLIVAYRDSGTKRVSAELVSPRFALGLAPDPALAGAGGDRARRPPGRNGHNTNSAAVMNPSSSVV